MREDPREREERLVTAAQLQTETLPSKPTTTRPERRLYLILAMYGRAA